MLSSFKKFKKNFERYNKEADKAPAKLPKVEPRADASGFKDPYKLDNDPPRQPDRSNYGYNDIGLKDQNDYEADRDSIKQALSRDANNSKYEEPDRFAKKKEPYKTVRVEDSYQDSYKDSYQDSYPKKDSYTSDLKRNDTKRDFDSSKKYDTYGGGASMDPYESGKKNYASVSLLYDALLELSVEHYLQV